MAKLARSPYYYQVSSTSGSAAYAVLTLKIYNTAKTPAPSAQYTLRKDMTVPTAGDRYTTFEVAELIRDYINISFDGSYSNDAVWVVFGYSIYNSSDGFIEGGGDTTLFLDGYGYFEQGANPNSNDRLLIDNKVVWRPEDENIRVPVLCDERDAEVVMVSKGVPVRTETLTGTNVAADVIKYASVSGDVSADNYKQRVLVEGIFENNPLLWDIDNYVDINIVDEIRVYRDGTYDKVVVRTQQCDKYPDRKVTFVNKNGAFQDLYFFAKEVESMSATGETYKSNVMNMQTQSYSTTAHQYQQYNKQAKDSVRLSTGFVSEDYNEVIKQLMMSEYVWLTKTTDTESKIYPVIPTTDSLTFRTSLNDKMVEYTIDFDYAFDKIQNIR